MHLQTKEIFKKECFCKLCKNASKLPLWLPEDSHLFRHCTNTVSHIPKNTINMLLPLIEQETEAERENKVLKAKTIQRKCEDLNSNLPTSAMCILLNCATSQFHTGGTGRKNCVWIDWYSGFNIFIFHQGGGVLNCNLSFEIHSAWSEPHFSSRRNQLMRRRVTNPF